MDSIELPDQMVENLMRFIRLNEGKLERKRREGESAPTLTDEEVRNSEAIVKDAVAGSVNLTNCDFSSEWLL